MNFIQFLQEMQRDDLRKCVMIATSNFRKRGLHLNVTDHAGDRAQFGEDRGDLVTFEMATDTLERFAKAWSSAMQPETPTDSPDIIRLRRRIMGAKGGTPATFVVSNRNYTPQVNMPVTIEASGTRINVTIRTIMVKDRFTTSNSSIMICV